MEEQIKELAEFIFENRDNQQTYTFSWAYEEDTTGLLNDEPKFWEGNTHRHFYNKAEKLLFIVDIETAKKIIKSEVFAIE